MPPAPRPLRHRGFLAGAALVALFAAASLLAPVLAPEDPHAVAGGGGATLEGPSVSHPLGTDALGRDVLSRVLWGGRASLAVGVGVETLVVVLGCAIGLLAGYFRGPLVSARSRRRSRGGRCSPTARRSSRPPPGWPSSPGRPSSWPYSASTCSVTGCATCSTRGCVRDTAACCPCAASSSGKRPGALDGARAEARGIRASARRRGLVSGLPGRGRA